MCVCVCVCVQAFGRVRQAVEASEAALLSRDTQVGDTHTHTLPSHVQQHGVYTWSIGFAYVPCVLTHSYLSCTGGA